MMRKDTLALRLCLVLVRACALLVPAGGRDDWRREWEAELRHRSGGNAEGDEEKGRRHGWRHQMDLVRHVVGALPDAAWIRRQFTADAEVVQDLRHAARMLRKTPAFTVPAVVILAVGIGGTVAIASFLDTLLLKPLPYAGADRIVTLWQRDMRSGTRGDVAPANFIDWRERGRSFAQMAALVPYSYDYTGAGEPEVLFGAQVTPGFFDALGVTPMAGRGLEAADYVERRRVAVITHGLWQRRFGGDPALVGSTIRLDGEPYTVAGVLPPGFAPQLLPRPAELSVWTPKIIAPHEPRVRGSAWWNVVGRLKPGVALEDARAEMRAISATLAAEYQSSNGDVLAEVVPLRDHLAGPLRRPLFVMFAAVILVLAIGCANVASLLLARGAEREREFAIRAALGAGRARLVRQLVVESLLLSALAAGAGIAMAWWATGAIGSLAPAGLTRMREAAVDVRMLVFAGGLAALTAVTFGLVPALQFSRPGAPALGGRGASTPRTVVRRGLIAAEVAFALVLLASAGLLLRSFDRLLRVDTGFSARNVVALQVFAWDRHPTVDQLRAFFDATIARLRTLPGVEHAGAVSAMPFINANIDIRTSLQVIGRPERPESELPSAYMTIATADYFHAMAVPLRAGRLFDENDREDAPAVAIVSDSLRRREWPDGNAIGQRVRVMWHGQPRELEIVGVVGELRHDGFDRAARPEVFAPHAQLPFGSMTYVIRASGAPASLIAAAKEQIWAVDPLQSFYETASVQAMLDRSVAAQRFGTTLVTAFALLALLLCATGVYGVISFTTAQRTREIGVRMALGANRGRIRAMVLREAAFVTSMGLVAGLAGAFATTHYLRTMLFEIHPADPLTLVSVCALLLVVGIVACYVPARRATRVNPLVALRTE